MASLLMRTRWNSDSRPLSVTDIIYTRKQNVSLSLDSVLSDAPETHCSLRCYGPRHWRTCDTSSPSVVVHWVRGMSSAKRLNLITEQGRQCSAVFVVRPHNTSKMAVLLSALSGTDLYVMSSRIGK